jgi:hypothetical protein
MTVSLCAFPARACDPVYEKNSGDPLGSDVGPGPCWLWNPSLVAGLAFGRRDSYFNPTATAAPVGAITGQLGYPSEFIPPVTVYAVNVADPRIFFSVDTLRYPHAVIAPGPQAMYTITGIVPGTYNVFAHRNDNDPTTAAAQPCTRSSS